MFVTFGNMSLMLPIQFYADKRSHLERSIRHGAVRITLCWNLSKRVPKPSRNERYKHHVTAERWPISPNDGTNFEQAATVQWYDIERGRTDLYSKAHHTNPGEIWQFQRQPVVAQVCSIHKDDKRNRHLKNAKFKRNSTTIPWPDGDRNQRHIAREFGQNALTEMTKTAREREPSSLPLYKLYTLFRLHYIPEKNGRHNRANFLVGAFPLKEKCPTIAVTVFFFRLQSSHWSVPFSETILKPPEHLRTCPAQGDLEQRVPLSFFHFFKETYKTGRAWRVPPLDFFSPVRLFFEKFFMFQKGPPFEFFDILQQHVC